MNWAVPKHLSVAICVVLLTACSSSGDKKDDVRSSARIEDRSGSATSGTGTGGGEDNQGATTHGLDTSPGLDASALDDPDSPLSVRVVYFDYDSSTIRSEFNEAIAAHAAYLAANPGETVTLEGHADERGSREYNLALGEQRALAVRRQLVLLGASAGQINPVSYGEERPAVDGHDESSYSMNRRVELLY